MRVEQSVTGRNCEVAADRTQTVLNLGFGIVAPTVEHLFCNQEAVGSNPTGSTLRIHSKLLVHVGVLVKMYSMYSNRLV